MEDKEQVIGLNIVANEQYLLKKQEIKQQRPDTCNWLIYSLKPRGLSGRVAVEEPFLRKGSKLKRLRCAVLHKNWSEKSVPTGLMK